MSMMKTNSKRLDDYIRQIEIRNKDLAADNLRGLSIATLFIPLIVNTICTNVR